MIAHLFSLSWATRWNLALAAPIVTTVLLAERFGHVSWAFIAAVYAGAGVIGLILAAALRPLIRDSYRAGQRALPYGDVFDGSHLQIQRQRDQAAVAAIEAREASLSMGERAA